MIYRFLTVKGAKILTALYYERVVRKGKLAAPGVVTAASSAPSNKKNTSGAGHQVFNLVDHIDLVNCIENDAEYGMLLDDDMWMRYFDYE